MTPFVAPPDYPRWDNVLRLLVDAFAYMECVTGKTSRVRQLGPPDLSAAASLGKAFLIEENDTPLACLFVRPSRDIPGALYLGWLAVDPALRNKGVARRLVEMADTEARDQGCLALTLDTGIELTQLHETFAKLGFTTHATTNEIVTFTKALT